MPKNVDAVALFLIVTVLLFTGFVVDHGPVCVSGRHVSRTVRTRHRYTLLPEALPPAPPVPALPPLPRI